ncbi:MAG: exodeoxyribonuclease V subunit alpha, partial [Arenimonas sp.]
GGWLRPVDHALALALRRARPDTADDVLAAAALASAALAQGHSHVRLDRVDALLAAIDPERATPTLPDAVEWQALLAASPWVAQPPFGSSDPPPGDRLLVLEGAALSLRRYWACEQRLATALAWRATAPGPALDPAALAAQLDATFGPPGSGRDESQVMAVRAALMRRLLVLTGGPGSGKTATVARLLAVFVALRDAGGVRIALAAPTGKAAARLAEAVREWLATAALDPAVARAVPTEATTVHRLLGRPRHEGDVATSLATDLVVVDEASMLDLPQMTRLLDALPATATLVLVGDPDQLPSVEAGDVLAAVCAAADVPGSALASCRVHLTGAYRQAQDNDVPALAVAVREGAADAVIDGLLAGTWRAVQWRPDGDRGLADAVLAQAVPAYRAVAEAVDPAEALVRARAFRVLCAVREGPAGSRTLNALVGQALDPIHGGNGWFRGRLLLVTENSHRQQLFNGDIAVVWPDADGEPRAWFDGPDGPRAWLPAALPAHEPAFALTVHKAQGSEFEAVLLALPERGARVLSRELLYTGLTRCRRTLHLAATADVLRAALARRGERWSGLARRLGG